MKLRWTTPEGTTTKDMTLQMWVPRTRSSECAGISYEEDGEWQDVPIVVIPQAVGNPPQCCGGGPQWGHAFSCPKCPD